MCNLTHSTAKRPAVHPVQVTGRANAPGTREQVRSGQQHNWSKKPRLSRSEASPWPTRARVDIRKTKFVCQQDPPDTAAGAARCCQTKSTQNQHRQIKPAAHSHSLAFGIGHNERVASNKRSAQVSLSQLLSRQITTPLDWPAYKGITHSDHGAPNSKLPLDHWLTKNTAWLFNSPRILPVKHSERKVIGWPNLVREHPARPIKACNLLNDQSRRHAPPVKQASTHSRERRLSTSPPQLPALNHIGSLTPALFAKRSSCAYRIRAQKGMQVPMPFAVKR